MNIRFWRPLLLLGSLALAGLPPHARGEDQPGLSRAQADYLRALNLIDEGSRPEALHVLAESLRLQPANNPAAALTFDLLTEGRTNSSLILRGHTGSVLDVAYSPDGGKIVTASTDHTARLWDAQTGRPLGPSLCHEDDVHTAGFSPDGTRVVTASEDQTARLWDAATGQPIGKPMPDAHEMNSARFSPDGKLVGTGADEGTGRVWDGQTGEPVSPPIRGHGSVFSVNFSPDSTLIVTATADARASVRDAHSIALLTSISHRNNVYTAVFSPDGARLLTSSGDATARVWDAKTGQPVTPVLQHGAWVQTAAFNRDATRVVTASQDHTARVWDARTGQAVTPPLQHGDAVVQAEFSPDGTLVATASSDHTARLWDAATGDPLTPPLRLEDEATTVVFNPAGSSILAASKGHLVHSWDVPPHGTPPPWLADLAEFASTQGGYNILLTPQYDVIKALRGKLLASGSGEAWDKFGRWYFLEDEARPISPWSKVSLREYVDGLIERGDKDSIEYAVSLSQKVSTLMARLAPLQAKFAAPTPTVAPAPPGAAKDDD